MNMEQKNELVKQYIINTSKKLNAKYNNILTPDKNNQAICIFTNSEKNYEEIIKEIDALAASIVKNYIKLQEQKQKCVEKQVNNKDRNSRTFEQIKNVQAKVQQLLDSYGLKIFISGSSVHIYY